MAIKADAKNSTAVSMTVLIVGTNKPFFDNMSASSALALTSCRDINGESVHPVKSVTPCSFPSGI